MEGRSVAALLLILSLGGEVGVANAFYGGGVLAGRLGGSRSWSRSTTTASTVSVGGRGGRMVGPVLFSSSGGADDAVATATTPPPPTAITEKTAGEPEKSEQPAQTQRGERPSERRLSAEDEKTIVDFMNATCKEDLAQYCLKYSEAGAIAAKKNAWTGGAYVIEEATLLRVDEEGLRVACNIVETGFLGKQKKSAIETVVPYPWKEGVKVLSAGEAKNQIMALSRGVGLMKKTAVIYKIPVGDYAGIPPNMFLNNIPHSTLAREFIYRACANAVVEAAHDPNLSRRMQIRCVVPELNIEMDTYRLGTMLEMIRETAMQCTEQGHLVKVCVQAPMGPKGSRPAMPLSLSGVMALCQRMDWGSIADKIEFGTVGADEISETAFVHIVIAPQSIVGASIHGRLQDMVLAAEAVGKPVVLINPILKDKPSSGDVMQIRGRGERLAFAESFVDIYNFRSLYPSGASYFPIIGAVLRATHRAPWVAFSRVEERDATASEAGTGTRIGTEEYVPVATFDHDPAGDDLDGLGITLAKGVRWSEVRARHGTPRPERW